MSRCASNPLMEQSGPYRDPVASAPDAGAPARRGWLAFRVANLTVVVGLLLVSCALLIDYGFYAGQRNIALLKSDYLAQGAEMGAREVFRPPEAAPPPASEARRLGPRSAASARG